MKNKRLFGLSLAIAFQFFILTGMYVLAAMPLWTGVEIKVRTEPVDPRSMFRGNYARLDYKFSQIKSRHFPEKEELRNGEKIYVTLKVNAKGFYEFSSVSLSQPDSGLYLSGRIKNGVHWGEGEGHYRVKYGIEAFFAPKKKALALEKNLRDSGVAILMVSSEGKARIKDVIAE
jgi:uncharacterized membrane-anchored protein